MQFLLHLVECRAVEDTPLGDSHLFESGQKIVGLELFVADKLDTAYGRSLDHHHYKRVAVPFKAHVTEETGPEQRANRAGGARAVDRISNVDREVVEYGTGGDSLETLQADVLDYERVDRRGNPHCGNHQERDESNA